ncbi:MAG TPA: DUF4230 domain-containing protein [Granulicella sp.]|jgi:hypothetical protein|nr:DUF4230 domain-containing protein [Granulicella sp.]
MTTRYDTPRRTSGSFPVLLLAAMLGAVALTLFLRHATTGPLARIATLITGRATTISLSAPAVVEKIQRLSRLETVVYSLDTVVEGQRTTPLLPDILAGDKLLLIVHGQSIAGVDLSQLKPEEVRIDRPTGTAEGSTIHVTLPASQIFVTALDEQHTRVYTRSTGLLVPADANLESDTRAKAQQQLQQAALTDGILDAARKNARATVTTLLYSLGFQHVDVK